MNVVFLIDGTSGTGKTYLINFAKEHLINYDINIIRKNTTRPRRKKEENIEIGEKLAFYTDEKFFANGFSDREKYWTYEYGGHHYSFSKEELRNSAEKHKFTFVIVRDKKLINDIRKDLTNTALTLHIWVDTDEELVRGRLKLEGFSDEDIEHRIDRNKVKLTTGKETIVIFNNSSKEDFQRKITLLVEKYSMKYKEKMELHGGKSNE